MLKDEFTANEIQAKLNISREEADKIFEYAKTNELLQQDYDGNYHWAPRVLDEFCLVDFKKLYETAKKWLETGDNSLGEFCLVDLKKLRLASYRWHEISGGNDEA